MKLKQIHITEAPNHPRFELIGTVYQDGGPILGILAERKGWCKQYDSRVNEYSIQRQCEAQ